MRYIIPFLLILNLLCFVSKAQQFAIQPGTISFNVDPGKTQTQVVRITNASNKKLAFQAYLNDWLRDTTGGHSYFRPDTLKRSCANWVTLSRNFVEVQPNQTEEILVTLNGPSDPALFEQAKWAMLFVQSVEEQETAKSTKDLKTQVKETIRVGIHLYQTPNTLTKTAAQALSLRPAKDKGTYEFVVANAGDIMLQCKATLTLTNTQNGEEIKLDRVEFPMFPEGKRVVRFAIPEKLAKGKYSALAVLDIGEDQELQAIEKSIEIK
jgi:P pilus assembly chaperone PapD